MGARVAVYFVASPLQYLAARRIAENFEAGARQVLVWYKPGVTPIVREADWDAAGYMPWPRWEPLPGPFGRHRRLRDNIRRVAALVGPCDSLHIHSAVFDTEAINYFLRALPKACGAREMRAHIKDMSRVAGTLVCAYPNAGLPNEFGLYDERPERRVKKPCRTSGFS